MTNNRTFTVYGRPACGFCTKAMELLTARKYTYRYINLYDDPASLQMIRAAGFTLVPQIYEVIDDKEVHIGGFADLQEYLK